MSRPHPSPPGPRGHKQGPSEMWLLLCTSLLGIFFGTGQSLVLVQDAVTLVVPSNFPTALPLYHVIAIDDATGFVDDDVAFSITRTAIFPTGADESTGSFFWINRRNGSVYFSANRNGDLQEYAGSTFAMEISGTSPSSSGPQNLTLVITIANSTEELCDLSEALCFLSSEAMYFVPETIRLGSVIGTLMPSAYQHFCPHIRRNYTIPPQSPIAVHGSSGQLSIIEKVDYEVAQRVDLPVTCQLVDPHKSKETSTYDAKLALIIKDVNDNAPYLQSSTESNIELDASLVIPRHPLPIQFTVLDKDSFEVNNINVTLIDKLHLFVIEETLAFHNVNKKELLFHTVIVPKQPFIFSGSSYNFSVVFQDLSLVTQENNKVIYSITITNETHTNNATLKIASDLEFGANVSRYASLHARVARPVEVGTHGHYSFKLGPNSKRKIFSVTPETGIIYVKNETLLHAASSSSVHLNLTWKSGDTAKGHCIVIVNIVDSNSSVYECEKSASPAISSCSENADEPSCARLCGLGATDGTCKWRSHPTTKELTPEYATCSPNLNTCPDRICDELEAMDKYICPQDCVDAIVGQAVPLHANKGIGMSATPCTCYQGTLCTCTRNDHPSNKTKLEAQSHLIERNPSKSQKAKHKHESKNSSPLNKDENYLADDASYSTSCGTACMISAGLIVCVSIIFIVLVMVLLHVKKSRMDKHKYIGNKVLLTAIGSDYVDDRLVTGAESQVDQVTDKNVLDPKWEFPREHLIFEDTLGEGQFGKVVKAQAWEIRDHPGYLTVAVKMLKENGTTLEEQDLISEFNLLKEVSHHNVIQLLGASTAKGGPLYVIVEFAEHGSLQNYLRNERKTQEALCRSVINPSYFSEEESNWIKMNRCGIRRELFSFAWQIAKGMAYLSDMKLVHRDLAARNILLTCDKIIKISDFGLSRDVYEGDTYLKTTKSRVPVKWMALESLVDHIYTIKSDVWSFGIVLWEIITLGKNPYPGIMAESLVCHLKDGYRMPQPQYCPETVYNMMLACWRVVPQERPSFKELVHKLDQLLQDTVDYLPLSIDGIPPADDLFSQSQTGCSFPTSIEKSAVEVSPRNRDKISSASTSVCKINIPKPCFSFTKNTESYFENSRLLPTSPEDSSGCDGSA